MPRVPVIRSQKSQRTGDSPINFFIQQAVENPNAISLAAGLVDYESLPGAETAAAVAEVLAQPQAAQLALQYGVPQGYPALRQRLLDRALALDGVTAREVSLSADDVVVTTGSQQLLYLLCELLVDPGDLVITEAPSYFVMQQALDSAGARSLTVPVDEQGMDLDALEALLLRLERSGDIARLRFIYVVDYFQNPTGLSLSLPRRQRLVELARRFSRQHRILIVEDAAYRELRYDGPDLPSVKRFDPDNAHVILAYTFSKPLAPGLKTGYGLLPSELVAPLLHLKGNHDFGSNNLTQHLIERLLVNGSYDRHVRTLCAVYRRKRDALLAALDAVFPRSSGVRWTHPHGGLYVWLTFPDNVTTGTDSAFMQAAMREGVLYVPGQFCYLASGAGTLPQHQARLSFGVASLE
ncbi:MAG: PLP-dependent aminotransferase family protein, partial [Planctomycetia bacterium]|nr:PLP-dependent aminotransferase family protein [Planctomycetia bacterium]